MFLRLRRYDDNFTFEDAFDTFSSENDIMGGVMVSAELNDGWKHHAPQGQVGYHGTSLAAICRILSRGLQPGPAAKTASNGQLVRGIFVHKHGTRHKARNYMN